MNDDEKTPKVTKLAHERVVELEDDEGRLTPNTVVEDAKNGDSPLHGYFNWDLEEAAHAHWITTARRLIRTVKQEFKIQHRVVSVNRYLPDPEKDVREQGYRSILYIKTQEELKEDAIRGEIRRLLNLLKRVTDLVVVFEAERGPQSIEDLDTQRLLQWINEVPLETAP